MFVVGKFWYFFL